MKTPLRTYGMRSRVAVGIDLDRIVIQLDPIRNAPVVELHGQVRTGRPTVARNSTAVITTMALSPSMAAAISEYKTMFGEQIAPGEGDQDGKE